MRKFRTNQGTIAEAVTALALLVPLLVLVVLVAMQASNAYVIARNMNQAALMAARSLAEEYRTNPGIVTNQSAQQAIFDNIRIPGMVSSNEQFSIPSDGWQTTTDPMTVTVHVSYLSGVGDPPNAPFPNPNVLNLDEAFKITMAATYRLAVVKSSTSGGNGNGNGNGNGKGGGKKK